MATGETAWALGPSPNEPHTPPPTPPDAEVTIADVAEAIPMRVWPFHRRGRHRDG